MKNVLIAALATLTLVACGGANPRVYLVATDPQPVAEGSLPTTCTNDQTSPNVETITGLRDGDELAVWDGVEGRLYLDIGGGALIESDESGKIFVGSYKNKYTDPDNQANTYTDTSIVTFDFSELAAVAKGNFSSTQTTECSGADAMWCEFQGKKPKTCARPAQPFVGRQIQVTNQKNF